MANGSTSTSIVLDLPIGEVEQLLMREFLAATRDGPNAVIVANDQFSFASRSAVRLMETLDDPTLVQRAMGIVASVRRAAAELHRTSGEKLTASFSALQKEGSTIGVLIRLDEHSSENVRRLSSRGAELSRCLTSAHLDRQIDQLSSHRQPVMIVGEPGVGKLSVSRRIHANTQRGDCAVVDAAISHPRDDGVLCAELTEIFKDSSASVVLHHADQLSSRVLSTVASLAAARGRCGARLLLTATIQPGESEPDELRGLAFCRLEVPPLRDRLADLPRIVAAISARHGATGRIQPSAREALASYDWLGNIRELEGVLASVFVNHRTCDITRADLPEAYQQPQHARRLTRMERIERAAIAHALAETSGNRTLAAKALEIGRATLYRKITAYGLDAATEVLQPAAVAA
jgi:DNA-binding NtrC family response regulator